jgi:hypothetical protein
MDNKYPFIYFYIYDKDQVTMYSVPYASPITEENAEAWHRYLLPKLKELITPETLNTPEFQAILTQIEEEKKKAVLKEQRQTHCRHIPHPKISYIPEGDEEEYEYAYDTFIQQQIDFTPNDREEYLKQLLLIERWGRKSIPQIMELNRPDAAYAIAVTLCQDLPIFLLRSELQEYHDTVRPRLRKLIYSAFEWLVKTVKAWGDGEKIVYVYSFIEDEAPIYREFRGLPKKLLALLTIQGESVIPTNEEYEKKYFSTNYIKNGFSKLWYGILEETCIITQLLESGEMQKATLLFMQLLKSYCTHYIQDEYSMYLDFIYDPNELLSSQISIFNNYIKEESFPEETKDFLRKAWREIQMTKAYRDGVPTEDLEV